MFKIPDIDQNIINIASKCLQTTHLVNTEF